MILHDIPPPWSCLGKNMDFAVRRPDFIGLCPSSLSGLPWVSFSTHFLSGILIYKIMIAKNTLRGRKPGTVVSDSQTLTLNSYNSPRKKIF